MTKQILLEAKGITRSYIDTGSKLEVLRGADLVLHSGDTLSITGNSGCGKSTFLNILGALDAANGGELYFRGEDVFAWSEKKKNEYRRSEIGFIFQFHHLLPEFSALENLTLISEIAGKGESKDRAEELLCKVGLQERLKHLPNELSGGERQRVAVARALINSPSLVLADEPSGNLDEENTRALHELFLQLNQDFGQTFVIVTHDTHLASLTERHLVMRSGILG